MTAEVKDISKMLTWVTGSSSSSKKNPAAAMNLDDIAKKIGELRPQLADILDDLEANPRSEDFGLSFLDLKTQLQISYLASLCYYLLLKVSDEKVEDHPVLNDLYFVRSLMEKIRPIDERLRYRVEKLLAADQMTPASAEDNMRPDVEGLMTSIVESDGEGDEEVDKTLAKAKAMDAEGDDKYVVPKFSSVEYTGDHVSNKTKAQKELERQSARLRKSELVRSMREELTDAPVEVGGEEKMDKSFNSFQKKLAHREDYEMENLTRLPVTKKDKKEMKHMRHLAKTGKHKASVMSLQEFGDVGGFMADLPADYGSVKQKKGKKSGGSALKGFREAQARVKDAASVMRKAQKVGKDEETKAKKKHKKRPQVSDFAF